MLKKVPSTYYTPNLSYRILYIISFGVKTHSGRYCREYILINLTSGSSLPSFS